MVELSLYKKDYSNGNIDYFINESGVELYDISLDYSDEIKQDLILIIPEKINDIKVTLLKPNSLNNIRKLGIKGIIIPNSVHEIGDKKTKLYSDYQGDSSFKLNIYFSFYDYTTLVDMNDCALTHNNMDGLVTIDNTKLFNKYFICINPFMYRANYWHYPLDGIWKKKDTLFRYTGDKKSVFINFSCIKQFAFHKLNVEEIIFGDKCKLFESKMISECDALESIEYRSEDWCDYSDYSISDCENLSHIIWPKKIIERNNKTLFYKCPSLCDTIVDGVLKSCFSSKRLYVVDKDVVFIEDYAFQFCLSDIVIISSNVKRINDDAFRFSKIKAVVFENPNTEWRAMDWNDADSYIYISEDGYPKKNAMFINGVSYKCFYKNINLLSEFLGETFDSETIINIIFNHMDRKSDFNLVNRESEPYQLKILNKQGDNYNKKNTDSFIESPEGTQLGEQYDYDKYFPHLPIHINEILDTENTGKYGRGLGNKYKLSGLETIIKYDIKNIICFHNPDEENGYLSNWYLSDFISDGIEFSSMEQYMMFMKAMIFFDDESALKILATSDVAEIKEFGRRVKKYNDHIWNGLRQVIVYKGLYEKFRQNNNLKEKLLSTGDAVLAECALNDTIWGIGISMYDKRRFDIKKWKGQGLLGFALMMVREELRHG